MSFLRPVIFKADTPFTPFQFIGLVPMDAVLVLFTFLYILCDDDSNLNTKKDRCIGFKLLINEFIHDIVMAAGWRISIDSYIMRLTIRQHRRVFISILLFDMRCQNIWFCERFLECHGRVYVRMVLINDLRLNVPF